MTRDSEITPADAERLLDQLTAIVARAATAILAIPVTQVSPRLKSDRSPVTAADEAAETVILDALARLLPGVPVVAEEATGRAAPALGLLWRGAGGGGRAERLRLKMSGGAAQTGEPIAICTRTWPCRGAVATVSRSHLDAATEAYLARLPNVGRTVCGSSVKFCKIAQGDADIYPRLARTSEWDIAAGHAVLAAAGGTVTTPDGAPLVYGRPAAGFRVPAFIACGDPAKAASLKA